MIRKLMSLQGRRRRDCRFFVFEFPYRDRRLGQYTTVLEWQVAIVRQVLGHLRPLQVVLLSSRKGSKRNKYMQIVGRTVFSESYPELWQQSLQDPRQQTYYCIGIPVQHQRPYDYGVASVPSSSHQSTALVPVEGQRPAVAGLELEEHERRWTAFVPPAVV